MQKPMPRGIVWKIFDSVGDIGAKKCRSENGSIKGRVGHTLMFVKRFKRRLGIDEMRL